MFVIFSGLLKATKATTHIISEDKEYRRVPNQSLEYTVGEERYWT
jgi:hypothetical protein